MLVITRCYVKSYFDPECVSQLSYDVFRKQFYAQMSICTVSQTWQQTLLEVVSVTSLVLKGVNTSFKILSNIISCEGRGHGFVTLSEGNDGFVVLSRPNPGSPVPAKPAPPLPSILKQRNTGAAL